MSFHWHRGFVGWRRFSLWFGRPGRFRRDDATSARALVRRNVVQIVGDMKDAVFVDPAVVFCALQLSEQRELQYEAGAIGDERFHESCHRR
jgi:hypothetical protein